MIGHRDEAIHPLTGRDIMKCMHGIHERSLVLVLMGVETLLGEGAILSCVLR